MSKTIKKIKKIIQEKRNNCNCTIFEFAGKSERLRMMHWICVECGKQITDNVDRMAQEDTLKFINKNSLIKS